MISFEDAQKIISDNFSPISDVENVDVFNLKDRVCAEDIFSNYDIQPFDNSAMDGFAINLDEAENFNLNNNKFKIIDCFFAGDGKDVESIPAGCALKIMTGAKVPAGTGFVCPVELTCVEGDFVFINKKLKVFANIRFKGQDIKKNDLILKKGTVCSGYESMTLASLGVDSVKVFRKIRVGVISSGDELITDFSLPLAEDKIYDSNSMFAKNFFNKPYMDVVCSFYVKDSSSDFFSTLDSILSNNVDIIVSFGGVSAGDKDFIKPSLVEYGADILYHKIKMRPGKPNLLAKLGDVLFFGLPGNPSSSAVALNFLVGYCVCSMLNMPFPLIKAVACDDFFKKVGFKFFLKGSFYFNSESTLMVKVFPKQESFRTKEFLDMNCWVVADEQVDSIKKGQQVLILPI